MAQEHLLVTFNLAERGNGMRWRAEPLSHKSPFRDAQTGARKARNRMEWTFLEGSTEMHVLDSHEGPQCPVTSLLHVCHCVSVIFCLLCLSETPFPLPRSCGSVCCVN